MRPLIDWIKVKDQPLPKDQVFLGLWKGSFCICEFDEDEDRFYICFLPAQMSGIIKVDPERVRKFTHWAYLKLPEDY